MADNNQQLDKPLLPAQKEFNVILDVLKVPLRTDGSNQKLPPHRGWTGGCLLELQYPDLVPVNVNQPPDPLGFCDVEENGLFITVENQGDADAPRSVTRVTFSPDVFVDLPTDPIDAGHHIRVGPFDIPEEQLDESGSFEFQIKVDANDQVVESNKENNIASGKCVGGEQ